MPIKPPWIEPRSQQFSLRTHLLLGAVLFIVAAAGVLFYATREYRELEYFSSQINQAGRLRMLSQRVALLTTATTAGNAAASTELRELLDRFDSLASSFTEPERKRQDAPDLTALAVLQQHWSEQRSFVERLIAEPHRLKPHEEALLQTQASQTLQSAERYVAMLAPHLDQARLDVRHLLPASLLLSALLIASGLWYVRHFILKPLDAIGNMMSRMAQGDMAARTDVDHAAEIGKLARLANGAADAIERNDALLQTALEQLRDSESFHRTLWEISNDAIVIINPESEIIFANPAARNVFGYEPSALVGKNIAILQPERMRKMHSDGMARYLKSGNRTTDWRAREIAVLHRDGSEVSVELSFGEMRQSNAQWLIGTFRDITERKRHQEELLQSVNYDALTGLPNRVLLTERIERALVHAQRHGNSVGVLYLDLDNFKIINDTLGHESGDMLLTQAAQRLQTCVRNGDTVARLGGDEFVILLAELHAMADLDYVAQRAVAVMATAFDMSGNEAFVGVSVGGSVYPEDASDRNDLLRHADIAMYRAKEAGRNNYQMYSDQMQARLQWRMSLETQLRYAIGAGEFVLHYQPQIELATGAVIGAEALIRWDSPSLGRVSPAQFIPLAEETGLIVPIGKWIIQQAISDAARWVHTPEGKSCRIAINLSPRQFSSPALFDDIAAAISASQLPARSLELEITEGLVMKNPMAATEVLKKLRGMGCGVALDDFGTGYSSLSYLRSFPIDCLKIDKSLITDVAIVRAVIQLARSFGFTTLAEGVEDESVLNMLQGLGCEVVQGFYYSKPLPLDQFQQFLQSRWAKT